MSICFHFLCYFIITFRLFYIFCLYMPTTAAISSKLCHYFKSFQLQPDGLLLSLKTAIIAVYYNKPLICILRNISRVICDNVLLVILCTAHPNITLYYFYLIFPKYSLCKTAICMISCHAPWRKIASRDIPSCLKPTFSYSFIALLLKEKTLKYILCKFNSINP